jgi:predicted SprT family Zn-dependent metalloprotease
MTKTNRKFRPYERREAITPIEYGGLQQAYDHFNATLFGGKLPDVFITYQRRAHSAGYFSVDRFSSRTKKSNQHELALNPDGFIGRSDQQIVQTLVHEMTHAWQHAHGKPPARGYHNAEWAEKMKSVGLFPSSTGMVGGRETGSHMSDYVIPDGPFVRSYEKLAATGWRLNLQSAPHSNPTRAPKLKTKFSCRSCGQNAWGKPDLQIICKPCGIQMRAKTEAPVVVTPPSEAIPVVGPVKRKRGRPKGSKNKPKSVVRTNEAA